MKKKCLCKRLKEGYINLNCPIHTVTPKIDLKHKLKKSEKVDVISLEKWTWTHPLCHGKNILSNALDTTWGSMGVLINTERRIYGK